MGIIAFLILGLLAGLIARAILPGEEPGGILVTLLVGVVGALLGGWAGSLIFDTDVMDEFFDISTWLAAIIGSIVVLAIWRAVVGRGGTHATGM